MNVMQTVQLPTVVGGPNTTGGNYEVVLPDHTTSSLDAELIP